jgi:hypothetical protein
MRGSITMACLFGILALDTALATGLRVEEPAGIASNVVFDAVVLAWWVKSQSVVSDEWVCEKLEMGSRTNIHRAVRAFRVANDRVRSNLKSELQLCAD